MNKMTFLVLGLAAGAALTLVASATAEEDAGETHGVVPSHQVRESFEMSVGVRAGDRPQRERKIVQHRTQLNLPQHYGNLIAVTQDGAKSVLWFRDDAGKVRNAIVEDSTGTLYSVVPTRTIDFETERRR